jgi:hypothetical protein
MADYSISQLTEDVTAADSDLIEVSKNNGDGTFTSRKQTRATHLAGKANQADLAAHTGNTANPHSVTKAQVGLSNVDNTADLAKPVSTATQTALDGKANTDHSHTSAQPTTIKKTGTSIGTRTGINLIEGTNVTLTVADDAINDEVDITITAAAGAGGYATVQEEGAALTARDKLNFIGATVTAADDSANGRTNVTINAAASTHTHPISEVTNLQTTLDGKADDADVTTHTSNTANPHSVTKTQVGLGNVQDLKMNLAATGAPAAANDSGAGYAVGSRWIDTTNDKEYVCVDATAAAAVWTETTQSGGSATNLSTTQTATSVTVNSDTGTDATIPTADGTNAGVMSAAQQTKLAGIESGATANSPDATLLGRANHTGTQAISTVANLQTSLDAKAVALHTPFGEHDVLHGYTLTKQGRILSRGTTGAWNEALVESPNVFWDPKAGHYKMVYVGYSGAPGSATKASLGYATSTNLETWTQYGSNPFFGASGTVGAPDENGTSGPFVWYEDGTYHLFYIGLTATGYEAGTKRICYATSTDFATWTRHGAIISPSGSGWRAGAIWHPNLVKRGSRYYLFFNASTSAGATKNITNTVPFTWQQNDLLGFTATYEAAE